MQYTNDEADKAVRQKQFFISVYVLPTVLYLVACGLIYLASVNHYLVNADATYCYYTFLPMAVFVSNYNKRNWLKMPDGTYHNIKDVAPTPAFSYGEPATYETEFYYAKGQKITLIVFGVLLIGLGIWFKLHRPRTLLIPIFTAWGGLTLIYQGTKGLLNSGAVLKIAKNGLWTKKLGFVNWDDINYAEVVEQKGQHKSALVLEVRIKGTKFETADQPDERLLLIDLQDNHLVETSINQSIINYNNAKATQL